MMSACEFPSSKLGLVLLSCCLALLPAACGYRVAGRGDRLPPDVKTIAIPIFENETPRFRIEQRVAAAVTREFIERTKFRINAPDSSEFPSNADDPRTPRDTSQAAMPQADT